MADQPEINRGYIPGSVLSAQSDKAWRGPLRFLNRREPLGGARQGRVADFVRLLFLPWLLLLALLTAALLSVYAALRRPHLSGVHADALPLTAGFVRQYPLHPYAIVCKALELACLRTELPKYALPGGRILEIAIGDGTLSEKVFPADAAVTATDIAPYSLQHAAAKPHVSVALVCDALAPPFRPGSFDLLVANNFLHHVTAKRETIAKWMQLSHVVVFNENTRYWASGWFRPFVLRLIGANATSERIASAIERAHLQHLEPVSQLEAAFPEDATVVSRTSYFSERTFFLAGLFSSAMRCTGPPTPAVVKKLLLRPLAFLALPLSGHIARSLIRYDSLQDRTRDAYVSFALRDHATTRSTATGMICPDCGADCEPPKPCPQCHRSFSELDGMLFALPRAFQHIETEYSTEIARRVPAEHL